LSPRACLFALVLLACRLSVRARDPGALALGFSKGDELSAWQGEIVAEQAFRDTQWATEGVGLMLFRSDDERLYGGVDVRLRANVPLRVSPYAGLGLFIGSWPYPIWETDDEDEPPVERNEREYLAGLYPEVGLHLWLTEGLRVSGHLRYYVTTQGREGDGAFYGFALGWKPSGRNSP
jgi:hypothetical protein